MVLTFSVITPSYQQGQFIERTIKSVIAQDIASIDYVVCDGGSKDNTLKILEKYSDSLRWISEPDEGQSHAVNKGLAMTRGDIIAWINSDDIYYPQAFQQVLSFFESNPSTLGVYGEADWIDPFDSVIAPYPTQPWSYQTLTKECYLCQPSVFFRRSLVERLGALNAELQYCMDYELWLRYGQTNPFAYLPVKLAGSRIYPTNKTFGGRLAAHREANEMLYEKFGYSTRHWIFNYSRLQLENDSKLVYSDLLFTVKLLTYSLKNCWQFNRQAVVVVFLKVILYQLGSYRIFSRSHPQFDVETTVQKSHVKHEDLS